MHDDLESTMPFLKISGSYCEMEKILNMPMKLDVPGSFEKYLEQIKLDLNRTCYFSDEQSVQEMQNDLLKTDHLGTYSYTQGDFSAQIFSSMFLELKKMAAHERLEQAPSDERIDLSESISTAYGFDKKSYGVSITYLRKDPDLEKGETFVPVEKRKRPFILATIENTIAETKDRLVTCFLADDLITPELLARGILIENENIAHEIGTVVKKTALANLISTVITHNGELQFERFNDLKKRFKGGKNIDNRDLKITQIDKIIDMALTILPHIQDDLRVAKNEFHQNFDLARDGIFEANFDMLYKKIQRYISEQTIAPDLKRRQIYDVELTYIAIQLQLLAADPLNTNGHYLLLKADELFERCNNKDSEIIAVSLENMVRSAEYNKNWDTFNQKLQELNNEPRNAALYSQGQQIQRDIEAIVLDDVTKLSTKAQRQLNNVLKYSSEQNIPELVKLSQEVSGKASPRWKKLGLALLVFAGVALVAAGILAAIPTGGSSLLLTIVGAIGMQASIGTASAVVGAGIAGASFFNANNWHAKGLAKSIGDYAAGIGNMQQAESNRDNASHSSGESGLGEDSGSEPSTPSSYR